MSSKQTLYRPQFANEAPIGLRGVGFDPEVGTDVMVLLSDGRELMINAERVDVPVEQSQEVRSPIAVLHRVRAVGDTDIALTGLPTVYGEQTVAGDMLLLIGQADSRENGLWLLHGASIAWTRPALPFGKGSMVLSNVGSYANVIMVCTAGPIVYGSTAISFRQLALSVAANPSGQSGRAQLTAGVLVVPNVNLSSTSPIIVTREVAITGVSGNDLRVTSRTAGAAGQFTVTSVTSDGVTAIFDVDWVNWMVLQ